MLSKLKKLFAKTPVADMPLDAGDKPLVAYITQAVRYQVDNSIGTDHTKWSVEERAMTFGYVAGFTAHVFDEVMNAGSGALPSTGQCQHSRQHGRVVSCNSSKSFCMTWKMPSMARDGRGVSTT